MNYYFADNYRDEYREYLDADYGDEDFDKIKDNMRETEDASTFVGRINGIFLMTCILSLILILVSAINIWRHK